MLPRQAPSRDRPSFASFDQEFGIVDRKGTGGNDLIHFIPGDWRSDWCTFPCAGRVGQNGGVATLVAEPVDEYPAPAFDFAHRRGETIWASEA